ncbi:MAG: FtsQ-type POTRA domain-containing protein, partial [Spirochaetes bacterium]|nr:FtsQ-type POTRA domain-containing protein [Spirochaetota bacterium]
MGKIIEGYEKNNVRLKKAIRTVLISFIVILIMLLVVGIVVRIQKMVLLPIKEVRVYGTGYIKNSEILNAINLDAYRSILSFSKKRAKASILQDKRITGIEIAKVYPDTLRIYIAEKEEKITLNVNDRLYR